MIGSRNDREHLRVPVVVLRQDPQGIAGDGGVPEIESRTDQHASDLDVVGVGDAVRERNDRMQLRLAVPATCPFRERLPCDHGVPDVPEFGNEKRSTYPDNVRIADVVGRCEYRKESPVIVEVLSQPRQCFAGRDGVPAGDRRDEQFLTHTDRVRVGDAVGDSDDGEKSCVAVEPLSQLRQVSPAATSYFVTMAVPRVVWTSAIRIEPPMTMLLTIRSRYTRSALPEITTEESLRLRRWQQWSAERSAAPNPHE
ncbi:hypothetical protein [Rhodococcus pyridinivorans]|uniref:hypothetical protein n=1 Tax=Rhodococcus pyridinivorans TaxID=103816 RepID=UPI003FA3ACFA